MTPGQEDAVSVDAIVKKMPKPYWQDTRHNLYLWHGDCRELLPLIPDKSVDLVLTDPPYGIGMERDYKRSRAASFQARSDRHAWRNSSFADISGDGEPFNPSHLLSLGKMAILWGANHYASRLTDSSGWLVWDKKCGRTPSNSFSDAELAWTAGLQSSVRVFRHLWSGYQRDSQIGNRVLHPTEKPVSLMVWCIEFIARAKTVLDPYCGSGTTLVAARNLGRIGLGIEIEEKYCELTARRLEQDPLLPLEKP